MAAIILKGGNGEAGGMRRRFFGWNDVDDVAYLFSRVAFSLFFLLL